MLHFCSHRQFPPTSTSCTSSVKWRWGIAPFVQCTTPLSTAVHLTHIARELGTRTVGYEDEPHQILRGNHAQHDIIFHFIEFASPHSSQCLPQVNETWWLLH